jgi:hypothetical protein
VEEVHVTDKIAEELAAAAILDAATGRPISEAERQLLLAQLAEKGVSASPPAIREIVACEDARFLAAVNRPVDPPPPKKPDDSLAIDLDLGVPPKPEPPGPAAPRLLRNIWDRLTTRTGRVVFTVLFVTAATFYFKDQRLAEEAKQKAQAQPPAPAATGCDSLSAEELSKLGLRRLTRAEVERLILPGAVVVEAGKQASPGFRVAFVENEHAFVESLGDGGKYFAFPTAALERKRVPDQMPPRMKTD